MKLVLTQRIRTALEQAVSSGDVDSEQKDLIASSLAQGSVPFSLLKSVCLKLRTSSEGPWIHEVCKGSKILLHPPKPRQRSLELVKRLEELRRREEERQYRAMVENVAPGDYEDNSFQLLPTFRLQLSFAAHVILTMVVFFFIGYSASRAFSGNPVYAALGGVLGLAFGLILETTLFILRSVPTEKLKSH